MLHAIPLPASFYIDVQRLEVLLSVQSNRLRKHHFHSFSCLFICLLVCISIDLDLYFNEDFFLIQRSEIAVNEIPLKKMSNCSNVIRSKIRGVVTTKTMNDFESIRCLIPVSLGSLGYSISVNFLKRYRAVIYHVLYHVSMSRDI